MDKGLLPVSSQKTLEAILNSQQYLFISFCGELKVRKINDSLRNFYHLNHADIVARGIEIFDKESALYDLLKDKDNLFAQLRQHGFCLTVKTSLSVDSFISWSIMGVLNAENQYEEIILLGHLMREEEPKSKSDDNYFPLESMLFNLPANIYWMDKNCVHLGCSKNVLDMLGITRQEYAGTTYEDLVRMGCLTQEQATSFKSDDLEVMSSGKPKCNVEEPPLSHADGRKLYFLTTRVPIRNQAGDIIGAAGISFDITERKKMEQRLIAIKKTEAANKAQAKFIANMSHDVKTPLSGMLAISELLNARVQPEYRHLTQDLLDAGQHLMAFFENCMELSRLESDEVVVVEEKFDLRRLLDEIIRLFQPAITSKGLALRLNYAEDIPVSLLGSRSALYRVLLNLVGNAVKFTSQGSITIEAKLAKAIQSAEAMLELSVVDTGVGIPKNKRKIVFERFFRLVPSYKGTYEGSGIGLYIAQKFIRSMGGDINVESEEGKGSQFTVVVPLKIATSADKNLEEERNAIPTLPRDHFVLPEIFADKNLTNLDAAMTLQPAKHPIRVLLVEDNFIAQKSVSMLMSSLGCQVDTAMSGEEAIALFKPDYYALVLMDIGLPDMKGYDVAKHFRRMEKDASSPVPILGLSAHANEEDKQHSVAAQMAEMLSKPLLLAQATALLERYVTQLSTSLHSTLVD